ncbi:unnamed protein product [Clavelina lepadiformis]|uniref:Uncharacterized protein n=1 Tax=Clavelina lepadiformis TaxID=159417 RepID=A0ABP0FWX5_CLALP
MEEFFQPKDLDLRDPFCGSRRRFSSRQPDDRKVKAFDKLRLRSSLGVHRRIHPFRCVVEALKAMYIKRKNKIFARQVLSFTQHLFEDEEVMSSASAFYRTQKTSKAYHTDSLAATQADPIAQGQPIASAITSNRSKKVVICSSSSCHAHHNCPTKGYKCHYCGKLVYFCICVSEETKIAQNQYV